MSSLSKQPVRPNSSQKTRGQGKDSVISKITPQNNSPADAHCCGKTGIRKTVLLSCSHVFHDTCLATFEELTCEERPVCPVCRSLYQKRVLSLQCFQARKHFANLCSLFLWRRKKFVTASKNMQDQIQIGIVLNCLWGYMELKWEPRNQLLEFTPEIHKH